MAKSIFAQLANRDRDARILDRIIPLDGASHADVVEYSVDIPLRYAECFARLEDGSKVRLRDARQFIAWSGWGCKRCFLFENGGQRLEIQIAAERPRVALRSECGRRKFVARDGNQMLVREWGRVIERSIAPATRVYAASDMYAYPQLQ